MINFKQLKSSILRPNEKLKDALKCLEKSKIGIVLICKEKKLIGVLSDGDLRRELIKSNNLNESLSNFCNKKFFFLRKGSDFSSIRKYFYNSNLKAIPILNRKELVGVITSNDFKNQKIKSNIVLILAGGKGKRMRPLTYNVPKPMIKFGNYSILENQLNFLKSKNFKTIYISTNYLSHVITEKFKDGKKMGLNISYLKEKKQLDTAGPLSLLNINKIKDPIIVINGDILAKINFDQLLEFHKLKKNDFTICVKNYFTKIPFGVIENKRKLEIKEKPSIRSLVNTGMYVCNPQVLKHLKKNQKINMSDFINYLSGKNKKIGTYLLYENIFDFSDIETYHKIVGSNENKG